jgi:hypothetical protein
MAGSCGHYNEPSTSIKCFKRPALSSTQPPTQWVPGVKRSGHESDYLPSASAEVKKIWAYTSTPPYALMS